LRGSGKTQLVGAIDAVSGRTLGVEPVASKSNEIPAGQTLLGRLDLESTIALMDALHTQVETARSIVQEGGGDYVFFVKGNQPDLQEQARHFLPEDFPPRLLTVEQGHGRIEWRGIAVQEVIPAQMGFPHVAQVARLNRIRVLANGRQEVETVWLITSLTPTQADARRLLELARQYWSIENGTHYPLDVSAGEDRCRVAHPVAATALGILRRAVQGEACAWARRQPRARDRTCLTFLAKMSRRPGQVIRLLTRPIRL
jgi:predicted transposase YbfD/YdcC